MSSARCASATMRWRPRTSSRTISSTTSPTNCARRSPTSSASRICCTTLRPARSPTSSANISATSRPPAARCSPSSTTFSISPRSTPARCNSTSARSTSARTIDAAAEGVRDRLREQGLTLDIRAADEIGSFTADERRIRQVLFNLLSNAIAFSPPGGTITLTAERSADRRRAFGRRPRARHPA